MTADDYEVGARTGQTASPPRVHGPETTERFEAESKLQRREASEPLALEPFRPQQLDQRTTPGIRRVRTRPSNEEPANPVEDVGIDDQTALAWQIGNDVVQRSSTMDERVAVRAVSDRPQLAD